MESSFKQNMIDKGVRRCWDSHSYREGFSKII